MWLILNKTCPRCGLPVKDEDAIWFMGERYHKRCGTIAQTIELVNYNGGFV